MKTVQHQFVEFIPEQIEEGILYISLPYSTAVHRCICGCGNEVVTPISPKDWQLTFDGNYVSLFPSIGNWNFRCRSHYWIKKNVIEQAERFRKETPVIARRTKLFSFQKPRLFQKRNEKK
jgi:hypothetical protein